MNEWMELAWESDSDEADAYQAAADAAEGERLRAALEGTRWLDLFGIDPTFSVGHVDCEDCRWLGVLLDGTQ